MECSSNLYIENIPLDFITADLEINQLEKGIFKTSINTQNLNNIVIRKVVTNIGYELEGFIQDYYIIVLYNSIGEIILNNSKIEKYSLAVGPMNKEFNEISFGGMEQYLILIKKDLFEKNFFIRELKGFQLEKNDFYRFCAFLNHLISENSFNSEEKNFYELIILDFLENIFNAKEYNKIKQNYYKKFYEISQYIKQRYHLYDISIDELVTEFNISSKTLRKIFASTIRMPPKKYIKTLKLNHLRRNLSNQKNSTITELMISSNLQYQSQVIKDFKDIFNVTPKAYKNFLKK